MTDSRPVRDLPDLEKEVQAFLAAGGKIYYAAEGETSQDERVSVKLGITSGSNIVIRDRVKPKKGYSVPDDLL
jgi:hypothetical protein